MKKLIKTLTGRTSICTINILIQIIVFAALATYLSEHYVFIVSFFRILSVLLVVLTMSANTSSSHKIPWLVLLLALPVIGGVIYLIFGNNPLGKKKVKKYNIENEKSKKYFDYEGISLKQVDFNASIYSKAAYLNHTSKSPVYQNTKSKYLKDGKEYFNCLFEKIKQAKKYIFIEYFIIADGQLWQELFEILKEKRKEGIEIYILYDDIGSTSVLPKNFKKNLTLEGIHVSPFNHFTPVATAIHDHRDHRKIVVIDGIIAFTGGINIGDEYANIIKRFGVWKDNGICLEGQVAEYFGALFIQNWNVFSKEMIDYEKYLPVYELKSGKEGTIVPFGDGPTPFDQDHIGEENYLNLINNAKKSIYITTPYLIVDYHILQALKVAAKRGVDVRIITPHVPDKKTVFVMTKNSYSTLIDSGVKIYEYEPGFIHAKMCICDEEVAFIGTINFDYRSLIHHFECGLILDSKETIKEMLDDYNQTLTECIVITQKQAKLNIFQKMIRNILEFFAPLL